MKDPRLTKLAELLVNYSISLKAGENCLIESYDIPTDFLEELVDAVYRAGGRPVLEIKRNRLMRAMYKGATSESLAVIRESELFRMKMMDAYIGIRGVTNPKELSDLPQELNVLYSREVSKPVHLEQRVQHTKWVVLQYPSETMAMMANMSTGAFEDYYFSVTALVDYPKMGKAMEKAVDFLAKADRVHIKGPGTDLSFSIRGIGAVKCSGECNIPDGEVYSCPIRDSVEGTIAYNTPSTYQGFTFRDVRFWFEKGRIVRAEANDTGRLNAVLDTDEGARYIGEFALGCNPAITFPMDSSLFDEKIAGSFHFTPGNAYDETDNGNRSAVHWDLVSIQTPEWGGGEIIIDDEIVRKDGVFVHPAFTDLNPESLSEA